MIYRATNYAMGREVASSEYEAHSHEEAARIAERRLRGKHSIGPGGQKVRVLGIRTIRAFGSRY